MISRQRATPLPRLAHPARGMALVVAGVLVLIIVNGVGSILVGCALVAWGVGMLLCREQGQACATTASTTPLRSGQRERIVHERERHTRERYWPMTG